MQTCCMARKEKKRKVDAFQRSQWEPPKAAAWSFIAWPCMVLTTCALDELHYCPLDLYEVLQWHALIMNLILPLMIQAR